jgi:nucleoside 2-deoxyribosyltransferase
LSKKINIFFSWQSQVKENKDFLLNALHQAKVKVNNMNTNLNITVDDATRGESGSPHIASTILKKIIDSDIFVADITPIQKPGLSNPNVCFELGFALAHLGWERIILAYNKDHGSIPYDVPFDFSGNRISQFDTNNQSNAVQTMTTALNSAIEYIIETPEKPNRNDSENQKTRKDSEMIRWLLNDLHIPTVQYFIEHSPHHFTQDALDVYDAAFNKTNNMLFYIYDNAIQSSLNDFINEWSDAFGPVAFYEDDFNNKRYIMSKRVLPYDPNLLKMKKAKENMNKAFNSFLSEIRSKHDEIDLMEQTKIAFKNLRDDD